MDKRKFMLASMCPAGTGSFSPVQVQKLFFLLDRNIGEQIGGRHFEFVPYDYGPFDSAVYHELEEMEDDGLVEVIEQNRFGRRTYRLTDQGLKDGKDAFSELDEPIQEYTVRLVDWVRSLTFTQLVSAIYNSYPEMKENSVFTRRLCDSCCWDIVYGRCGHWNR